MATNTLHLESVPATEVATNPDADILSAWRRYCIARATYSVLPDEALPGERTSAAEDEQCAIMDAAEKEISEIEPTTTRGAEIKLWFFLARDIDASEVFILSALREDMRWMEGEGKDELPDWRDRLVLSAIRSLRMMQAGATAAA